MPRKSRSPFVVSEDGSKFVAVNALTLPLIALIDGLTICTFKGDKRMFWRLADAIAWVEKEMENHSRDEFEKKLAALRQFESEPVTAK